MKQAIALTGFLLLGVGVTLAGEGRLEIFEPIVLDGALTNVSGRYFLSRDIVNLGTGFTIRIVGTGVENVDIDLNGFTVTNTNAGTLPVISLINLNSATVHGGSVISMANRIGVQIASTARAEVEDVSVRNAAQGIALQAPKFFTVRRCRIGNSSLSGIHVFGSLGSSNIGTIEENVVLNSTDWGIVAFLDVNGLSVRNNHVRNTGNDGILIQSSADAALEVRGNRVRNAAASGISVGGGFGCTVAENVVGESTASGIVLFSDGCLVVDNVSNANGEAGVVVLGDRNHIERNVAINNGVGLEIRFFVVGTEGSENTFGGNTARGNTGSPMCNAPIGSCSSPDFCDAGTGNVSIGSNVMPGPC